MSGAGARPSADYVWRQIQNHLQQSGDAAIDEAPVMTSKDMPWPVFLMFLLAHGWFLKPKVFPLERGTGGQWRHPSRMINRMLGFGGAWILAVITLPLSWVALAAAIWVAVITPGIIDIHRKFQHVD